MQQRTGLLVGWQRLTTAGPLAMYQLSRLDDPTDSVGLYQAEDGYVDLCCDQPRSCLAEGLVHTLVHLGGGMSSLRRKGAQWNREKLVHRS